LGIPSALISLLASNEQDIESAPDKDISDLARALLRVLVSAKEQPAAQHLLDLEASRS
jgi:hypothetical protein